MGQTASNSGNGQGARGPIVESSTPQVSARRCAPTSAYTGRCCPNHIARSNWCRRSCNSCLATSNSWASDETARLREVIVKSVATGGEVLSGRAFAPTLPDGGCVQYHPGPRGEKGAI